MSKSRMKRLSIQRAARKAEHTPGPWTVFKAENGRLRVGTGILVIAEIYPCDPGLGPQDTADACLIAAAPHLLAALEAAEIEIENLLAPLARAGRNAFRLPLLADVSTQRTLVAIRAALTKARG